MASDLDLISLLAGAPGGQQQSPETPAAPVDPQREMRRQQFIKQFGVDPDAPDFQRQVLGNFASQALPTALSAAAGPVGRGVGTALRAAPKIAAPLLAALGIGASTGEAGSEANVPAAESVAPTAGNLTKLYEQQSVLQQQAEAARQQRESMRPRNRRPSPRDDPQFTDADAEFKKLSTQLDALNQVIADEQKRGSPEHALEMQKRAAMDAEDQKRREAAMPFRERYPQVAGALPAIGLGLSAALPFMLKGKGNLSSFYAGSPQGQMRTAVTEAQAARTAGDAPAAALREAELRDMIDKLPTAATKAGKAGAAAFAGGALTSEANMFPDQYDAYNLPEGDAKKEALTKALSVPTYLERGAMGALTGLSGYKAGELLPSKGAPVSLARALTENPYTRPAPPAPAPVTTKWGLRDPRTGHFVRQP